MCGKFKLIISKNTGKNTVKLALQIKCGILKGFLRSAM